MMELDMQQLDAGWIMVADSVSLMLSSCYRQAPPSFPHRETPSLPP